jgi:hypothetical protein
VGEGDTIQPLAGFFLGDGAAQKLAKLGRLIVAASASTNAALAATADNDATQDARIWDAKDCFSFPSILSSCQSLPSPFH